MEVVTRIIYYNITRTTSDINESAVDSLYVDFP